MYESYGCHRSYYWQSRASIPRVALRFSWLRSGGGGEVSGAPLLQLPQLLQLRVNRVKIMKVIN